MANNQKNRIQFIASFDRYSYVAGQLAKQAVFKSVRAKNNTEILKELVMSPAEVDMPESFRVNETIVFAADIHFTNIQFISTSELARQHFLGEVQND
jgi:hypothetical protein